MKELTKGLRLFLKQIACEHWYESKGTYWIDYRELRPLPYKECLKCGKLKSRKS